MHAETKHVRTEQHQAAAAHKNADATGFASRGFVDWEDVAKRVKEVLILAVCSRTVNRFGRDEPQREALRFRRAIP